MEFHTLLLTVSIATATALIAWYYYPKQTTERQYGLVQQFPKVIDKQAPDATVQQAPDATVE